MERFNLDFTKPPVQESSPTGQEKNEINLDAAKDLIERTSASLESTGPLSLEDETEVLEMIITLRELQDDPTDPIDSPEMRAVLAKLNDIYNKGKDASNLTVH